jgi:hypothetical protein
MSAGGFYDEQVTLERVQAGFEQWRRGRDRRGPIPVELWHAAAELTSRHTYQEVSKALRVNSNDLKRRAVALQKDRVAAEASASPFVEADLLAMGNGAGGEFVLEWEGLCGGKMRIRVRGKSEVDVVGVVGALGAWGR